MTEAIKKSLRESKTARWTALGFLAFAMFAGYLFTEILSPLKPYIESDLGWNSADFGAITGGYGVFNVFLFALIFVGLLLDRLGIRISAIMSAIIMVLGACIKYYALTDSLIGGGFGYGFGEILATPLEFLLNAINKLLSFGGEYQPLTLSAPVALATFGYALFGIGVEYAGITVSKGIVKWFKGREMALAMGMEMALARLGSFAGLFISPFIADSFHITTPFAFGVLLLIIGMISFILYNLMDTKLDKETQEDNQGLDEEDKFNIKDLGIIFRTNGFWYIAILCVLFYSAVFPFYKYGPDLMVNKFGITPKWAGLVPSLVPFGTIFLTPFFGNLYDRKGKGASIMILGAVLLIIVHVILWLPFMTNVYVAALDVIVLGIAFSLVPSAMWPSVPKLIPEKQLGSAYAMIFWIQNIGLTFVPIILGIVLNNTNPGVAEAKNAGKNINYDYSSTWLIFVGLTVAALIFAFLLKWEDKRKGYGLELPNIEN